MSKNAINGFRTTTALSRASRSKALEESEHRFLVYSGVGGAGEEQQREATWVINGNRGKTAYVGRVSLLVKASAGLNIRVDKLGVPDTIEETAKLSGWLKAAGESYCMKQAFNLMRKPFGKWKGLKLSALQPLIRLWASPHLMTVTELKGFLWFLKNYIGACGYIGTVKNKKFFWCLGKLKPQTRWAAVSGIDTHWNAKITHRDINWEAVSKAQKGMREAEKFFPYYSAWRLAWNYTHPSCSVLPESVVAQHKPNVLRKQHLADVLDMCLSSQHKNKTTSSDDWVLSQTEAAIKLALMFKSREMVRRYAIKLFGVDQSTFQMVQDQMLHDAAQSLPIAKVKPWWSQLLLAAPAQMQPLVKIAGSFEAWLGDRVPKNVSEALALLDESPLKYLSMDLNDSEKRFIEVCEHKAFEECPQVSWSKDEYTMRKLDYNDPEQLTAGRLVNCCQHVGSVGAPCAKAAYTEGSCAIYAIYKGSTMVVQSFAWRSKDGGSLVFDSVEALSSKYSDIAAEAFSDISKQLIGRLGIEYVLVSQSSYGVTRAVCAKSTSTMLSPKPAATFTYSDVGTVCDVLAFLEIKSPKKEKKGKKKAIYQPQENPVVEPNTLVVCEHCDAVVGCDAEVCWSCHANIAEWV